MSSYNTIRQFLVITSNRIMRRCLKSPGHKLRYKEKGKNKMERRRKKTGGKEEKEKINKENELL